MAPFFPALAFTLPIQLFASCQRRPPRLCECKVRLFFRITQIFFEYILSYRFILFHFRYLFLQMADSIDNETAYKQRYMPGLENPAPYRSSQLWGKGYAIVADILRRLRHLAAVLSLEAASPSGFGGRNHQVLPSRLAETAKNIPQNSLKINLNSFLRFSDIFS